MTRARDIADLVDANGDIVADALDNAAAFPSGTVMVFKQTSAPTGWTKITTDDDAAMRIVSGTVGSGGSSGLSTALATPSVSGTVTTSVANTTAGGSIANTTAGGTIGNTIAGGTVGNTTLVTNQIPSHNHGITFYNNNGNTGFNPYGSLSGSAFNYNTGNRGGSGGHSHNFTGSAHNHNFTGTAHNHTFTGTAHNHTATSTLSSSTASINVKYVDVIAASKS